MKVKKEYLILIALIIALSLYLIMRNPDRTHYQLPDFPEISGKDISKIEIEKGDTTIVLNKKDKAWHIAPQEYPADAEKIQGLLDTIEELSLTAMVSEARDYKRYDLNDAKKITVRAWIDDSLIREFEVGKAAASYQHTFLKLPGDDRVYHAQKNFRGKFDQTVDSLRDKTILSFDQDEIEKVHITKGKQSIVLHRKQVPVKVTATQKNEGQSPPSPEEKTVWETPKGKRADESRLNHLLSTLSKLRCEKYIDNQVKNDFTSPICTLQLSGNQEYTLSIFSKPDKHAKDYPAISSQNDYPFLLGAWRADDLMKNPDELVKKPDKS